MDKNVEIYIMLDMYGFYRIEMMRVFHVYANITVCIFIWIGFGLLLREFNEICFILFVILL
jgi:hypothetical protein